jgi:hypothetical protein
MPGRIFFTARIAAAAFPAWIVPGTGTDKAREPPEPAAEVEDRGSPPEPAAVRVKSAASARI